MSGIVLASEVFKSVNKFISLIPNASQRIRKRMSDETEKLVDLEQKFERLAVSFKAGENSDELMGVADEMRAQMGLLNQLIVINAKEM